MAVYYSQNPLEWFATDGTYVAEQTVPGAPTLQGSNVVQLVGNFPWGPTDQVVKISDTKVFVDTFIANTANPEQWSGVRALTGKRFGVIQIVRLDATGAAAAARTVDANGYKVTAKYKGAAGNQIEVKHVDLGAGSFDVIVRWGGYVKTYAARTLANVEAIVDDYVVFELVGTEDTVAASDSDYVALSAGANGTPVDADYLGGVADVSGLRLFENEVDGAIVVLDEYTSAAAITALRNHAALKRAFSIAQAAAGDFAANIAAAGAVSDDRLALCLHKVRQLVNGVEYTVDLAPFAASMLSQLPPHYSLADEELCRDLLKNIVGAAGDVSLSRAGWIEADQAGGLMLEALEGGGFKFHANLTTSTVDGLELISTRRVKDVAIATVVKAIAPFQNKPGMPFYDRAALSQAQRAITLLKGNPDSQPQSAILQDGGVVISTSAPVNTTIYQVALSLWGETRYQIINITAGIDLVIEEVLAAA